MTVRIGIIGTGQMGAVHAAAAQRVEGAELVAVAGGTRATELAARSGVAAERTPEALLDRPDIDAVVIATPHTSHRALVAAAAERGRHVFLEKPMAVSLDDCDAMTEACDSADVTLMVAHVTRYLEAVRRARAAVDAGDIGEPRMMLVERLVDGYPLSGWPLDPREGSSFLDWGSHGCDIVRWFMGAEPRTVAGQTTTFGDRPGVSLSAMALFGFPDSRMATVWQSYEMPGPGVLARARYVIVGSSGTLDLHAYGRLSIDHHGRTDHLFEASDWAGPGAAGILDSSTFLDAFGAQMAAFVGAIASGGSSPVPGSDGRAAVAMVLAAERSARDGTLERLDA